MKKSKLVLLMLLIIGYIALLMFCVSEESGKVYFVNDDYLFPNGTSLMTIITNHIEQLPIDVVEEIIAVEDVISEVVVEENDLYWLSRIISAEARGESEEGQMAVGNVVMNRVKSDKFPNTIKDVIFQKGQFCPVRNKSIYKDPTESSIESAKKVLNGEVVISSDAIYFYAPKWTSRSNWIRSRKVVNEIGVHRFAK